jgi:hypothetical protein
MVTATGRRAEPPWHARRVFAVTRLRAAAEQAAELVSSVEGLLAVLGERPGFRGAEFGRAAEDPALWALVTRWDGVGAYRRALSAGPVKIAGAPVWVHAVDEAGVFLPDDEAGTPAGDGATRGSERA